ncbi:hypothetical protein JCM7686_1523 [Paracoccus aminophilus JCM 7686]|uniref:Uncharacterized protein n=1 Tax=Paracoccus aminophilus JCM 7686 TaxID=1367847 RepID=S5XMX5_PARAH|nr:hypothetical protein JCM7686_1523 [Paracoccus aminophilus JCM 7686]
MFQPIISPIADMTHPARGFQPSVRPVRLQGLAVGDAPATARRLTVLRPAPMKEPLAGGLI